MKTTSISELERTAALLSLEDRREEKLLRQSEKRQSPNHLVKVLQQKQRIPSSARNQPLEMLQNYEDWQAETPTIILDIPSIQAKEHHTDEELRSLTLEVLSVAYPSTTWARAYKCESAEEAAKMSEVEFSSSSLMAVPSGSLWLQGSSQQTTELKYTPCSQKPRP